MFSGLAEGQQAQQAPLFDLDPSYLLTLSKSSLPARPGSVGVSWVGVAHLHPGRAQDFGTLQLAIPSLSRKIR